MTARGCRRRWYRRPGLHVSYLFLALGFKCPSGHVEREDTTYDAGAGGLTRLPELARGVSPLCLLVGLAKNGGEDGGLDSLGEDKSQGDSRRLDGGKVWCDDIR